jgi:predicted permease
VLDMMVILNQIGILMILIMAGFVAGKMGYLSKNTGKTLSKIVVGNAMPSLVFTTMLNYSFSPDFFINGT